MISRCIPIRWDDSTIEQIDDVARDVGITRSALVKMAVRLQLMEIRNGSIRVRRGGYGPAASMDAGQSAAAAERRGR